MTRSENISGGLIMQSLTLERIAPGPYVLTDGQPHVAVLARLWDEAERGRMPRRVDPEPRPVEGLARARADRARFAFD
jgi:hypothetical protein